MPIDANYYNSVKLSAIAPYQNEIKVIYWLAIFVTPTISI